MTGVLIGRGDRDTEDTTQQETSTWRQTRAGRMTPCPNGGRSWNNESTSQEIPRMASKHQELEEAEEDSLLQVSEGAGSAGVLISIFQNCESMNICHFHHPVVALCPNSPRK